MYSIALTSTALYQIIKNIKNEINPNTATQASIKYCRIKTIFLLKNFCEKLVNPLLNLKQTSIYLPNY